jgi:hypothetical protein
VTFNEMVEAVLKIFPGATFGDDFDGQIVIYTDLKFADESQGGGTDILVPLGDVWAEELDFPDKLG